jgi:hypothetical protein
MVRNPTLKAFKKEVLDKGAEACLPANLSDDWLAYLDKELSSLDDERDDDAEKNNLSFSVGAVVTILLAKHGRESLSMTYDELYIKMVEYRIEIGLEIVHRRTDIKFKQATLANIFTNRNIECKKV